MSGLIRSKISTNGFFGYFDLTNPNSYAYTGAREWRDLSGNGMVFNLAGQTEIPIYNPGTGGLLFSAANQQYAISPPSTAGPRDGEYTWGVWAKFTNPSEPNAQLLTRGRDTIGAPSPDGWSLTVGSISGYYIAACTQDLPSNTSYSTSTGLSKLVDYNTWVNIVGTFKRNDYLKLYVNGVLDNQVVTTSDNLRQSIGAGWAVASIQNIQFASCVVASAMIYNMVLSDSEILQNYNSTKSNYGL